MMSRIIFPARVAAVTDDATRRRMSGVLCAILQTGFCNNLRDNITPQLNNEPGTRPSNISLIGGTSCLWTVVVALISIGLSTLNVYELRRLKEHGLIVQNVVPATSPGRPLVPITSPNKPVYSVYGKSSVFFSAEQLVQINR
ncbi:unnamed protein product, partial [Timema podura]|nr:unnamed protein product [Timema podura]